MSSQTTQAKYQVGQMVSVYLGWGADTTGRIIAVSIPSESWIGIHYTVVYPRGGNHFAKSIAQSEISPLYRRDGSLMIEEAVAK